MIPEDKIMHFCAGIIAYCSIFICLSLFDLPLDRKVKWSILVAGLAGGAKEIRDFYFHGDCDVYDWVATLAGGIGAWLTTVWFSL
jgi:hypothetical protein